jgi:putative heme-binding domain-containing protein
VIATKFAPAVATAFSLAICVHSSTAYAAPTVEPSQDVRAQVEAGKRIFESNCVMCHGLAGSGGRGPALAGRDLRLDLIRDMVRNGRPGTAMPAFKDVFDVESQAQVMAYVLWLASSGSEPTKLVALRPSEESETAAAVLPATPSSQPVDVGKEKGVPARGSAIFFDATRFDGCRACHSYRDKGGGLGPDLADASGAPLQIYRSITRPRVAAADYPAVSLSMRDGTRIVGVKAGETDGAWQVFDVSSVPPVLRTVRKSEVAEVAVVKNSGIYDHTALHYSKQDLLDLSTFLGKTESATSR